MSLFYSEEIVNELRQKVIVDLQTMTRLTKEGSDPELLAYTKEGLPVLQAALDAAEKAASQR